MGTTAGCFNSCDILACNKRLCDTISSICKQLANSTKHNNRKPFGFASTTIIIVYVCIYAMYICRFFFSDFLCKSTSSTGRRFFKCFSSIVSVFQMLYFISRRLHDTSQDASCTSRKPGPETSFLPMPCSNSQSLLANLR